MRAARVGVAAHVGEIDLQGAEALGAVHDGEHAPFPCRVAKFFGRHGQPGAVGYVGEGHDFRRRGVGPFEGIDDFFLAAGNHRDRHVVDLEAEAPGLDLPRLVVRGMVQVGQQHLVARPEVIAGADDVVGLARVPHQRDLVRVCAQETRHLLAGVFPDLPVLHPVVERRVVIQVTRVFEDRFHHRIGRWAEVRGVHQCQVVPEEELAPHRVPVPLVAGIRAGDRRLQILGHFNHRRCGGGGAVDQGAARGDPAGQSFHERPA